MTKGGRPPSQSAIHEDVFGRGDEPLRAPKNMSDLHVMIIYDVCQVIGGETICFHNHGVTFHLEETTHDELEKNSTANQEDSPYG